MTDMPQREDLLADWLTRDEAAKLLKRTVRTVARMIDDGRLAAVRHGQDVFVPLKSIADYKAKLEAAGAREAAKRSRANSRSTKVPA